MLVVTTGTTSVVRSSNDVISVCVSVRTTTKRTTKVTTESAMSETDGKQVLTFYWLHVLVVFVWLLLCFVLFFVFVFVWGFGVFFWCSLYLLSCLYFFNKYNKYYKF